MAAFAHGAGHLALKGHPDLFCGSPLLHAFQRGEAHHGRRADDDHVVVLKAAEGHLLDIVGHKALVESGSLSVVQTVDGVEARGKFLQLFSEQHGIGILEAGDEVDTPAHFRVGVEMVQCGAYRRHAGAAADHHQVFALELLHREGVAVRAAHEQRIPGVQTEDTVGEPPHLADGEFHIALAPSADGDGGLTHLWDGQHEKLAVAGRAVIGHPEGVLRLCLLLHAQHSVGLGQHDVFHSQSSFRAASSSSWKRLMVSRKSISRGQRAMHRPQPTHIFSPASKRFL